MIHTVMERLNDEIQRYQQSNQMDRAGEAAAKLQTVTRLWSRFGSVPLVQGMQKVVGKVVQAYHLDFYELDLSRMEQIGDTPFCWFVRDHGTDLLPLEGDETMIQHAEAWFHAIRLNYTDGLNVKETQRLFICNPKDNTMKRLNVFSGTQFRVISTVPVA